MPEAERPPAIRFAHASSSANVIRLWPKTTATRLGCRPTCCSITAAIFTVAITRRSTKKNTKIHEEHEDPRRNAKVHEDSRTSRSFTKNGRSTKNTSVQTRGAV